MSVAYQCERCLGYGPNEPVAIVTVSSKEPMPKGKGSNEYDLCGKCLDELRDFLTPAHEAVTRSVTVDVPFGGSRYGE